jgi:photosystem I subunit 10
VCANTAAIMGAMRFGLMPSVKKNYNGASSHTAMVEQASTKNIGSRDPAGFTAVDVLAAGSFATIISAGEILAGQVPY